MFRMIENWMSDFRIAALSPPEPQHPDIIIISINEETLERFPYRSPIDRGFLADLLGTLEQKGVRGILLDILLDQPTEADKDARLKQRLQEMRIPTVVSYGVDHSGKMLTTRQTAYLDDFLPPGNRGFANLVKDTLDGTVRWIFPGDTLADGSHLMGVGRELAARLGVVTPAARQRVAWRAAPDDKTPPFKTYPAHFVPLLPEAWLAGKIALIGVDLTLTDRHRTPFSLLFGGERENEPQGMPGVVVHAHGLAQLLDGRSFPDLPRDQRYAIILGATLFGLLLAWLEVNLYLTLAAELLGMVGLWLAGLAIQQRYGVIIPLLAPTLASLTGFWAMQIYTGSEARRQKRMAEAEARIKAELLANMSHEIRTPINAVIGMAELVLEEESQPTKRKHLSTVISSAKSLPRLINDILDYSKMESGKMRMEEIVFDLRQNLEETLATLTVPAQSKGLTLTLEVDPALPDCFVGDPTRLRQVVVNLVGNAIKFTETGGVTVRVADEAGAAGQPAPAGMLRFTVIDTGIGIAPDRLEAIFESYAQAEGSTARKHGGTGLGTTISKQIVEQMRGRIWVESELGRGSRFLFVIHLPRAAGVADCRAEYDVARVAAAGQRRTFAILLADDIEENIALAEIRLGRQGHRVTSVRNGIQVLETWERDRFDLILMDVNMPKMGGFEATRLIREREAQRVEGGRTLIIALTAGAGEEDREACLQAGMDEFVSKPIEFNTLFDLLENLVPEGAGELLAVADSASGAEPDPEPGTEPGEGTEPVLPPPFDRELPGIDARRGLSTWGNLEVYRKALTGFARSHEGDMAQIRAALAGDDVPAAKAVAHGLKGVAGNLSATRLAEAATRLDTALRQRQGDATDVRSLRQNLAQRNIDLEGLVDDVGAALGETIDSCRSLESKPRAVAAATRPRSTEILPEHRALAQRLVDALEHGNATVAEECLTALEKSGIVDEATLAGIAELVDDFDFGEALGRLRAALAELGIVLEEA